MSDIETAILIIVPTLILAPVYWVLSLRFMERFSDWLDDNSRGKELKNFDLLSDALTDKSVLRVRLKGDLRSHYYLVVDYQGYGESRTFRLQGEDSSEPKEVTFSKVASVKRKRA